MGLCKIEYILKERWKFYLIGYIVGYAVPLITDGIKSWQDLFSLKLITILITIGVGYAIYYGSKKMTVLTIFPKALKFGLMMTVVITIVFIQKVLVLKIIGFDITPFIGVTK